eukprot:m.311404 g.311404  ORF g.311404 m.311404 type:complete len:208 (+) comp68165_c0_seq1:45-668(+)
MLPVFRKGIFRLNCHIPRCCFSETSTGVPRIRSAERLQRIVRVDHAGEYAADRIYAGQMAVLGSRSSSASVIQEMWDTEKVHLTEFERVMKEKRVRPTALLPVWHVAGYALGAASAFLGTKGAMACTIAVEEVIEDHYNSQLRSLMDDEEFDDTELLDMISKIRDEEVEHRDIGIKHSGSEVTNSYSGVVDLFKTSLRTAIWLSERF